MKKSGAAVKMPFQPNKKLGQNFLFEKDYLHKIIECYPLDTKTIIIEIGSGYGNLTKLLAETNCQQVIGIEKDWQLFSWLEKNNSSNKIVYLHQDALKINWVEFCRTYKNNSLIVVGNLPYYITNSLIVDLLLDYYLFKSLIFLVQKEVGQKWVANPNQYSAKYSALSVFINYLAKTKLILEVPAGAFTPSPSVDGVLISIEPYQETHLSKKQLVSFLKFLKNCFRFRRKTLLKNLASFAGDWNQPWRKYFAEREYNDKIRPQNLTPGEYFQLFLFWKR